jgi:hypothetical protein
MRTQNHFLTRKAALALTSVFIRVEVSISIHYLRARSNNKIRYPCKCSNVDPEHTVEDSGDGWTRHVCSSCGKVNFVWSGGEVKDSDGSDGSQYVGPGNMEFG